MNKNMKISKQRLIEIIEEECAMVQEPHSEYSMDGIDKEGRWPSVSYMMWKDMPVSYEMLTDTTQLESWVQAKLTKAADYIKTVKHYVEYGMEEGAYDQVMPETDPMDDHMR